MNQYQDDDWQQEEQRRREAYYRMNSQNSNTPDALEQIFRGPLNWMNLLMKTAPETGTGEVSRLVGGLHRQGS